MAVYHIYTDELSDYIPHLKVGDRVYLSGIVYTARDAAHLRLINLINQGHTLPFEAEGSVIYYAGPSPTNDCGRIGSFGPTTSSRMDAFSPVLLDIGSVAMIGKGNRNKEVIEAIRRNKAVYFCAGGGFGALISKSIQSSEVIAFPELGCESIKKLIVSEMPLVTAIDCDGNSIFDRS